MKLMIPILTMLLLLAQNAPAQLLGRAVTPPTDYPQREVEPELQYSEAFDIANCVLEEGTEKGLLISLPEHVRGRVYYGVTELTADPPRPRLRKSARLRQGKAELNLAAFCRYPYDIARFDELNEADIHLQFEIWDEDAASTLLLYRIIRARRVDGVFRRALTIEEGPIYSCVVDGDQLLPVISLRADRAVTARVLVEGCDPFVSQEPATRHEIRLPDLAPLTEYRYQIEVKSETDRSESLQYLLTTPPLPGSSDSFKAVLMSDCRAGVGAGDQSVEGVNRAVLGELTAEAWQLDPDLMLFAGDLINGWEGDPGSYIRQLHSFKRSIGWFLPEVPLFTGMGNHETLLHYYDDGSRWGIALDRTPYTTGSAEALFAAEFAHPTAAPAPEAADAPPYSEAVYALPWGRVLFLMLNSNYWYSSHPEQYGGNVEGGMLDNQLQWLEEQVRKADSDPTVDWIVYATHEPTFPNGGHPHDSMWYHGGAPEKNRGRDRREVIVRRDRWWSIIAGSPKSLLVYNGDEHNYSRTLIDAQTPVYPDHSSNPAFIYPVWQIISGGAGAPYYTQAELPWSDAVECFSTRQHLVLLQVTTEQVLLQAVDINGTIFDELDLTEIRRP